MLVFTTTIVPGRTGRLTISFVLQMMMKNNFADAFKVFLEHWVMEENKAKRRLILKSRQKKIKVSVFIRVYVLKFFETLEKLQTHDEFHPNHPVLRKQLRKYAYFLGKSGAPNQICRFCGHHITRFELNHFLEPERCLFISCQNQYCGRTEFSLGLGLGAF